MRALARLGLVLCLAVPALAQGAPALTTKDLAGSVQSARLSRTVDRLASFGTRHTLSDAFTHNRGIGAARLWLGAEFQSLTRLPGSRLVAFEDGFRAEPGPLLPEQVARTGHERRELRGGRRRRGSRCRGCRRSEPGVPRRASGRVEQALALQFHVLRHAGQAALDEDAELGRGVPSGGVLQELFEGFPEPFAVPGRVRLGVARIPRGPLRRREVVRVLPGFLGHAGALPPEAGDEAVEGSWSEPTRRESFGSSAGANL